MNSLRILGWRETGRVVVLGYHGNANRADKSLPTTDWLCRCSRGGSWKDSIKALPKLFSPLSSAAARRIKGYQHDWTEQDATPPLNKAFQRHFSSTAEDNSSVPYSSRIKGGRCEKSSSAAAQEITKRSWTVLQTKVSLQELIIGALFVKIILTIIPVCLLCGHYIFQSFTVIVTSRTILSKPLNCICPHWNFNSKKYTSNKSEKEN